MQYFTPKLWLAFQGPRSRAAFKTFDRKFKQYRKSLDKILSGLGPAGRRFFRDPLILHDGTLTRMELGDRIQIIDGALTWQEIVNRRKLSVRLFVLAEVVKQRRVIGNCWYILEYKKVERINLNFPGEVELFPAGRDRNVGDWGYDELSSPTAKVFRHEILFSSGATIAIDFSDFSFRRKRGRDHLASVRTSAEVSTP